MLSEEVAGLEGTYYWSSSPNPPNCIFTGSLGL